AGVLTLESDALPAAAGLQADAHVDVPDVRIDRDELRARVRIALPGLPARDGRDGRVVVVEEQDLVRVQEVDEGTVVLGQLLRARLVLPGVGHFDRAAQGGARPIDLELGDDVVDFRGLPPVASRKQGESGQRHDGRRTPGTSKPHLYSPRLSATDVIIPYLGQNL